MSGTRSEFKGGMPLSERQRFISSMALICGLTAGGFALSFAWILDEALIPSDLGSTGLVPTGLMAGVFLLAYLLAQRARLEVALWLVLAALAGLIVVPPFLRGIGIYSLTLSMLSVLVLFSGLLGGKVVARRSSLCAVLLLLVLYLLTRSGYMDSALVPFIGTYFPPLQYLVVHVVIVLVTGWITGWYAAAVNDSHRQLQQRAQQLEETVGELQDARRAQDALNAALEERTRDAESGSRAKSRFLALMSHEIRTPLNGVIGVAQLLKKPGMDERARSDLLETIIASGRALHAVTNDMLDLSKVESGRMDLLQRTFDCNELLQQALRLFAPAARARQLWLGAVCLDEGPRRYVGDDLRLLQMISNLVGNAIKYSERGGVNIAAREIGRDSDSVMVEFSVADTGIGIPADSLHLLFEPFSQVEEILTRRQGGSGLGLAIVRQLAELMQGEVGVDSTPGQGSRFWFTAKLGIAPADPART